MIPGPLAFQRSTLKKWESSGEDFMVSSLVIVSFSLARILYGKRREVRSMSRFGQCSLHFCLRTALAKSFYIVFVKYDE